MRKRTHIFKLVTQAGDIDSFFFQVLCRNMPIDIVENREFCGQGNMVKGVELKMANNIPGVNGSRKDI